MITIISGTNRKGSNTLKIAKLYETELKKQQVPCQLLSLEEIDMSVRNEAFIKAEQEFLVGVKKFIIVMPEYNGSFPGILKLMIDHSDIAPSWHNKKAMLVGVSTGRAGNLRGMEHLTGSLLHIKMHVHHNRLPISLVHTLFLEDGTPSSVLTSTIEQHAAEFID